jgi:signal transduction histidine kinase
MAASHVICIRVIDNGPSIPLDDLLRVFGRF